MPRAPSLLEVKSPASELSDPLSLEHSTISSAYQWRISFINTLNLSCVWCCQQQQLEIQVSNYNSAFK